MPCSSPQNDLLRTGPSSWQPTQKGQNARCLYDSVPRVRRRIEKCVEVIRHYSHPFQAGAIDPDLLSLEVARIPEFPPHTCMHIHRRPRPSACFKPIPSLAEYGVIGSASGTPQGGLIPTPLKLPRKFEILVPVKDHTRHRCSAAQPPRPTQPATTRDQAGANRDWQLRVSVMWGSE